MWIAWEDLQWNRQTKEEHYLMQIACEVRRSRAKEPDHVKLEDLKIPFKFKTPGPKETAEEYTNKSLAMWSIRLGGKIRGIPGVTPIETVSKGPKYERE